MKLKAACFIVQIKLPGERKSWEVSSSSLFTSYLFSPEISNPIHLQLSFHLIPSVFDIYTCQIFIWSGVSYWVGFIHLAWCWLCLKITSKFFDCQTLSLRWQIFWMSHMLSLSFFKTNIPQIFLKYSSWQIFWKSHMLSPIFLLTFMLAPGVTRMSPLAFCWRQNYEKSLRILRQI